MIKRIFLLPLLVVAVACFSFKGRFISNFSLDDRPTAKIDSHLLGRWKMTEDPDNGSYLIVGQYDVSQYKVTYVTGRGFEEQLVQNCAFFSKMDNARFLNVALTDKHRRGYVLFKVTDFDSVGGKMTLHQVIDTAIVEMESRQALRVLMANNAVSDLNFGEPIHLYRLDSASKK